MLDYFGLGDCTPMSENPVMFTTLIDGATLVSRGGEPGWIVVDCRAALGDPDYGRTAYGEGHVPGARYADLDRDLAAAPGKRGRHPLPDRDVLAERFAAWGIRHGDQLVAYDDAGGQFACRFWWLARWLGVGVLRRAGRGTRGLPGSGRRIDP